MENESSCQVSLGRRWRALLVWPQVRDLLECRLCWKIAFAVMVSILAIEIVVLIPSYQAHQRDLMAKLHASSKAAVIAGFKFNRLSNDRDLLRAGKFLVEEDLLKGGSLYRADGTLIGHFGERPDLTPALAARDKVKDIHPAGGRRMDLIWTQGDTGLPFTVVGHLDSSKIAAQMMAYVMRIAGLVLIISLFVCAATMFALSRIILVPLLQLRAKLGEACDDPANPEKCKLNLERNDEFGDVVDRFNTLLHLISQTHGSALAEQAMLLQAILDYSPTKIHIKDADGRYVLINGVSELLFGVANDEARGKTSQELFSQPMANAFSNHDRLVMESGETIELEEEWIVEGGVRTFLTAKFPILDTSVYFFGTGAF